MRRDQRQTPALHTPFAHSLSGSVPLAIDPQTPLAPPPFFAAEHAWHAPEHVELQHTLSTQKPLWHVLLPAHVEPLPSFGWQVVEAQ